MEGKPLHKWDHVKCWPDPGPSLQPVLPLASLEAVDEFTGFRLWVWLLHDPHDRWELVLAFTDSDYKPYQDLRCPGPLGTDGNIEPGNFSIILGHQNTHSEWKPTILLRRATGRTAPSPAHKYWGRGCCTVASPPPFLSFYPLPCPVTQGTISTTLWRVSQRRWQTIWAGYT